MFARKTGKGWALAVALVGVAGASVPVLGGCNEDRQRDCHGFVEAMAPLDAPDGSGKAVPSLDAVNGVKKQIEGLKLQDQPLQIYRENYVKTLAVLANTLEVKASSMPPDGVDDVIKKNLKEARSDAADVRKYCAN